MFLYIIITYCARGGYGSNYLPLALDPMKIVSHPKILVGYSDITTLVCCISDSANFVTFHGPMAAKDFAIADGVDMESWQNALGGAADWSIAEGSGARAAGAGPSRRNPLRRMPLHAGGLARHPARDSHRRHDPLHRRRCHQALPDRPHVDATETSGQTERRARHRLRRNAGLPPESRSGLHARRSCPANCRRPAHPRSLRPPLRPRLPRQHHAAHRRASKTDSRRQGRTANSRSGNGQ